MCSDPTHKESEKYTMRVSMKIWREFTLVTIMHKLLLCKKINVGDGMGSYYLSLPPPPQLDSYLSYLNKRNTSFSGGKK